MNTLILSSLVNRLSKRSGWVGEEGEGRRRKVERDTTHPHSTLRSSPSLRTNCWSNIYGLLMPWSVTSGNSLYDQKSSLFKQREDPSWWFLLRCKAQRRIFVFCSVLGKYKWQFSWTSCQPPSPTPLHGKRKWHGESEGAATGLYGRKSGYRRKNSYIPRKSLPHPLKSQSVVPWSPVSTRPSPEWGRKPNISSRSTGSQPTEQESGLAPSLLCYLRQLSSLPISVNRRRQW